MGEIIFNGRSSRDIGLEVETFPMYQTPKRSYEKVHIPGRNGDLLIDSGSWENATRTYYISIGSHDESYYSMMNRVYEWLRSTTTYARLEDSYEPECYRLAVFLEESDMSNIYNQGGKTTIEFDCKPQRFLKIGDEPIDIGQMIENLEDSIGELVLDSNGRPISSYNEKYFRIQNPTGFVSLPIINVYGYGSGTLTVGDYPVIISEIGGAIIIDSEIQDAYYNTINKNSMITIPNGFPKLSVGKTSIGFSGGITKVEVVPKWFTL